MNKKLLNFSLINIDKPGGPTSFTVSSFVRKKLNLKKTSHMGTLDPAVTGVLPITLGRACKLAGYFIGHDKEYIGILHTHKEQNLEKLQKIIDKNFVGKISQIPPHKSAVKRAKRTRMVHFFRLIEESSDSKDFVFECKVQGGTYIRKICSDLGEKIGGAHMNELRRTVAGIFDEETLITLDEFEKRLKEDTLKEVLVSAESAIKKIMPELKVKKQVLKALLNGKPLFEKDLADKGSKIKEDGVFALFCGEQFVGIYKKTAEKRVYARPEFVYSSE